MTIPIVWQPDTRASHHERLTLVSSISRLASMGSSRITCRHPGSGRIYQFDRSDRGWKEMSGQLDIDQIDIPAEGSQTRIVIETMYRDGANYKNHHEQIFEGTLTHRGFDILLTALFMDFDGIIPHQIGMTDHQDKGGRGLDMDSHDHPWHEIWGFEFKPPLGDAKDISALIEACQDRIKNGWDALAATVHLQEIHSK